MTHRGSLYGFQNKKLSNALDGQLKNFKYKFIILHDNLMTHFLGKAPAVFKTKELSNALDRQLKNLMTHFLGEMV